MNNQNVVADQTICHRRERRFKASVESPLACETALGEGELLPGTVVDLSTRGVRLLCEGQFEPGQPISTELTTDRSHGVYRGVVRRVEPWVGGQSILGCSLNDPIPDSVLDELFHEGVVCRRTEERISLCEKAKVTWPLNREEVEVDLQDYSTGGMRILSSVPIPDDVRLRLRIEVSEETSLIVDAKSVWKEESEDGCIAGIAFTHRDTPVKVAEILGLTPDIDENRTTSAMHYKYRFLGIALGAALLGFITGIAIS